MAIISIIGTSGVGKSFLVRQLSSYFSCPAFLEGEEGTIPKTIFESVFNGISPEIRCGWYVNRYYQNFNNARKISKCGVSCFVDGAPVTAYANIFLEKEEIIPSLLTIASKLDEFRFNKTILITANSYKLEEFIKKRGRKEEPIKETLKRSLKLQEQLLRLTKDREDVLVIDRSHLDFTKEEDLKIIIEKLKGLI